MNCITLSAVLERGWTRGMVKQLLPAPVEKQNPYYRNASPMLLFAVSDVEAAEGTEAYREARAKADRRCESAKKAVRTKRAALEKLIDSALESVSVEVLPFYDLRDIAVDAKEDWEVDHGNYDFNRFDCPSDAILRWMVNFVRHNLTAYDDTLDVAKGKTGIISEYSRFREGILAKIAETYAHEPLIVAECRRQLSGVPVPEELFSTRRIELTPYPPNASGPTKTALRREKCLSNPLLNGLDIPARYAERAEKFVIGFVEAGGTPEAARDAHTGWEKEAAHLSHISGIRRGSGTGGRRERR